jgi:UDP-2-acetamido-3-amino-2,3-dideoxy-glucuronate N-acetyltransferase
VLCGIEVGEFAFVGAGALINANVPDYALMVGLPARQIGWMSQYGEQLNLPLHGEGEATCPHTGQRYRLEKGQLRCVNDG